MKRPDSDNAAGAVQNIVALAGAGYKTEAEQASGLTGLQLEYHEPSAPDTAPQQAALNSLRVRYAPTMLYPPARAAFEAALNSKAAHLPPQVVAEEEESEPPMTKEELAALKALGAVFDPAQIAADAELAAREMMGALRGKQNRRREVARNADTADGEHECTATRRPCPLSTVPHEVASPMVKKYKDGRMKAAIEHAKAVLPREVITPLKDVPSAALNGSDIKEMLNPKAVYASARNGVTPEIHEEAVLRTPELVARAEEVSRRAGGKKDRIVVKNGKEITIPDPVAEIVEMDADFTGEDGEPYTARYSVQKYRNEKMQPKIYFMYCQKSE